MCSLFKPVEQNWFLFLSWNRGLMFKFAKAYNEILKD